MPLITIVLTLVVVGVLLWLLTLIPMDAKIRNIINVLVIIFVVLWILQVIGVWGYLGNVTVPRVR